MVVEYVCGGALRQGGPSSLGYFFDGAFAAPIGPSINSCFRLSLHYHSSGVGLLEVKVFFPIPTNHSYARVSTYTAPGPFSSQTEHPFQDQASP